MLCRVEQHLVGNGAVGRNFFQFMHKARLLSLGKVSVLDNFLVDQVKLIHRGFFTQGEIGNYHIV